MGTQRGPGLELGQTVGPYVLEEVLGSGGMGIVYRATRRPDGAVVTLKVLRQELSRDDLYRRRFLREARVAAEVVHKHLVPILDAGEDGGRQYLAARYVAGGSLESRIAAEGPLALEHALRVAAEVGAGLDALHEHGLVHRDVKPSNVMLEPDGSAALTDFGLATGRAYTVLTKQGQVMGTLDYLAPELIRGQEAGPASDLYSLGCVAYECLTGAAPFAGRGPFQIGIAHLGEEPPDPCTGRDLRPRVGWAVLQALRKDPAERPPSGAAYARLLRLAAEGRGSR